MKYYPVINCTKENFKDHKAPGFVPPTNSSDRNDDYLATFDAWEGFSILCIKPGQNGDEEVYLNGTT